MSPERWEEDAGVLEEGTGVPAGPKSARRCTCKQLSGKMGTPPLTRPLPLGLPGLGQESPYPSPALPGTAATSPTRPLSTCCLSKTSCGKKNIKDHL